MLKFGTVWNYLVLGGMLACSACIGIYFWRQQQDSPDDTLLGGRNMHVIPVTFSLVGKSSNILDLNPSPLFPPILHLPSLLPPSFSNPFHPSYLTPSYPPAPSEFPLCDHPAGDAGGGVHPGHPVPHSAVLHPGHGGDGHTGLYSRLPWTTGPLLLLLPRAEV